MILCFHEISYVKKPYCCSPVDFKSLLVNFPNAEIHFDDGRKGVIKYALPILQELKRTATIFLVPKFIAGEAPENEKYSDFLTLQDINKLIFWGNKIGSHTNSHRNLTKLDNSELTAELIFSRDYLEKNFENKIKELSIPYGIVDERVMDEAKKFYEKVYTLDSPLGIKRQLVLNTIS